MELVSVGAGRLNDQSRIGRWRRGNRAKSPVGQIVVSLPVTKWLSGAAVPAGYCSARLRFSRFAMPAPCAKPRGLPARPVAGRVSPTEVLGTPSRVPVSYGLHGRTGPTGGLRVLPRAARDRSTCRYPGPVQRHRCPGHAAAGEHQRAWACSGRVDLTGIRQLGAEHRRRADTSPRTPWASARNPPT
jgi:hypothetical protein